MILSANTQLSPTGEDAYAITIEELLRRRNRAGAILKPIHRLGAHCVCLGSDTPLVLMLVEVAKYNALPEGGVTAKEKQMIAGAARCTVSAAMRAARGQ